MYEKHVAERAVYSSKPRPKDKEDSHAEIRNPYAGVKHFVGVLLYFQQDLPTKSIKWK